MDKKAAHHLMPIKPHVTPYSTPKSTRLAGDMRMSHPLGIREWDHISSSVIAGNYPVGITDTRESDHD